MRSTSITFILLIVLSTAVLWSCGSKTTVQKDNSDVLVSVGDSSLTVSDVLLRMPSGLTKEDSLNLFNRIVEEWVRDLVLSQYAEDNVTDMDRIDEMVETYRRNLIVNRYLQMMGDGIKQDIPDQRIKEYYDVNKESLLLEQPLVKGIFLKISENDEKLNDLRNLVQKFDENSIDEIEKIGAHNALKYKYFNDNWVEWDLVAEQIPHRFEDADAFLKSSKIYEVTDKGNVYLLRISDYIPSGSELPYDYAKGIISEILHSSDMKSYRDNLITDIYKTQIQKGKLVPGLYDPLTGKVKKNK